MAAGVSPRKMDGKNMVKISTKEEIDSETETNMSKFGIGIVLGSYSEGKTKVVGDIRNVPFNWFDLTEKARSKKQDNEDDEKKAARWAELVNLRERRVILECEPLNIDNYPIPYVSRTAADEKKYIMATVMFTPSSVGYGMETLKSHYIFANNNNAVLVLPEGYQRTGGGPMLSEMLSIAELEKKAKKVSLSSQEEQYEDLLNNMVS